MGTGAIGVAHQSKCVVWTNETAETPNGGASPTLADNLSEFRGIVPNETKVNATHKQCQKNGGDKGKLNETRPVFTSSASPGSHPGFVGHLTQKLNREHFSILESDVSSPDEIRFLFAKDHTRSRR